MPTLLRQKDEDVLDQQPNIEEELSGELPVPNFLWIATPRYKLITGRYTLWPLSTLHDKLNELSRKEGATLS